MPPNAAATESWKNRSGSASDGDARVGVDVDDARAARAARVASTTSRAVDAGPDRSASIAVIRPPSTATSATRDPAAVTTVPPRTTRSATVSAP